MKYMIDGRSVSVDVSGAVVSGDNLCLIENDDNLISECEWLDKGFAVFPVLDQLLFFYLQNGVKRLLLEALDFAGCAVPDKEFCLERYHECCSGQEAHIKVVDYLRSKADVKNLPIDYQILDEKVSGACGQQVSCRIQDQVASGYFFIRIVRPGPACDNNPPHRDAWLDRLRHCINLYLPLAGSDGGSSLPVAPGSHFWPESCVPRTAAGALANGMQFSVPSVVMEDDVLEMTRPAVEPGEAMLFSPYLIHGGAVNFNKDRTRVSLEMRFWRKK